MKNYNKPNIEKVEISTEQQMCKLSGWNVDGEHQGGVEEGELPWGENDSKQSRNTLWGEE